MHKLYLGPLQALEQKLFGDIAVAKGGDPFYHVIVAVESNLAGVYLGRALAGSGSYCRVSFLTLPDLAVGLAELMPEYASRKMLPPLGEEWLAALAAREAGGGYFGPVAGRPGFRETLLQTFRELEGAGLQQIPLPPDGDAQRIGELQRIFDRFRELRRPFANRTEAFALAARKAPAAPFFLAIYGIYTLSAPEKKLLASLAGHVRISMYWQECAVSSAFASEARQWILEHNFTLERLQSPSPLSGNLARLQSSLFQANAAKEEPAPAGDESLAFICAPDEIREAEEITREIIRLARAGVRFGEMAVLLPHPMYSLLIRERLAAAGIPCYLAGGVPLAQTRSGRSLLMLLQMMGGEYSRREVMDLLGHAPFDYRRIFDSEFPVSPSFWDYLTRQAGVIKGRQQWQEALGRYRRQLLHRAEDEADSGGAGARDGLRSQIEALDLLLDCVMMLFDALESLAGCRSWTDLHNAAGDLILRFFHTGEEREALRRLLKKLRRLDECGGEFELAAALDLFKSALGAAALPLGRFQHEGVNLLPLDTAAGLRFTAVFIPGLAEKIIPAPVKMDPLLPEVERLALGGVLPLRRRKLEEEALRFTLALGGVLRKAILTWPRTAAAGSREQLPSFFLSRCGEALLGLRPGYEQLHLLPGYRYIPSAAQEDGVDDPITDVEFDLNCCRNLPQSQQIRYYRRLSAALYRLIEADVDRRSSRLGPHEGLFTPRGAPQGLLAARLAAGGGAFSATALEEYARCPYSYFLKRLLRLTPLEEPGELLSMEPLERGRLIHYILEQFYRRAAAGRLLPVQGHPEACRTLLKEVAGEAFDALPPEELADYPLLRQLQRHSFKEMLLAFLDWEIENASGYMPVDFEIAFGLPGESDPVFLHLPSGEKLYLRGRIDRVDRCGGRIRVIDYKTGRKRLKDESLAGGEALQLPVYLLAAGTLFKLPQPGEVEAFAYHLSSQGVKTVLFSGDPWPQKERLLQETAAVLYKGITAGRFFPYPNPSCRYCDYRDICGPDMERRFRLKAADPALEAFTKMKEESS